MLNDVSARVLLTSQKHANKLRAIAEPQKIICIDSDWDKIELLSAENLEINIESLYHLAVCFIHLRFTGKPKGVQIEHTSIAHHLNWFTDQYKISSKDSSLLISSFSFDGAMMAIWPVSC